MFEFHSPVFVGFRVQPSSSSVVADDALLPLMQVLKKLGRA